MSKIMETKLKSMDSISIDLSFEILLRLPVKSVARFVCVSNYGKKTIRSDEFIRSFSLRSSSKKQPRLLCALKSNMQQDWRFFTKSAHVLEPLLDLPQRLDGKEPCLSFSLWYNGSPSSFSACFSQQDPSYAHGLISYLYGDDHIVCNVSTGKYITLPVPHFVFKLDTFITRCFLGYDPINGQYKVLCSVYATRFYYYQVLTLGAQNCSWRLIQYNTHRPRTRSHVCIKGVLYYIASINDSMGEQVLVRFDLRSESLEVVSVIDPQGSEIEGLINYHGKVAVVKRNMNGFSLRVLEDANKQKWSNEGLTIPTSSSHWIYTEILGTSDMGEIVFINIWFENVVYFLDQTSNKITSVQLKGSTKHKLTSLTKVHTFLHYVESAMFV